MTPQIPGFVMVMQLLKGFQGKVATKSSIFWKDCFARNAPLYFHVDGRRFESYRTQYKQKTRLLLYV